MGEKVDCANLSVWYLLAASLASLVSSSDVAMQSRACDALYSILADYPEVWEREWATIFVRAVAPVFEYLFYALDDPTSMHVSDKQVEVLQRALQRCADLCLRFSEDLKRSRFVYFDAVARAVAHRQQAVADVGISHLREWVSGSGGIAGAFDDGEWSQAGMLVAASIRAVSASPRVSVFERSRQMLDIVALATSSKSQMMCAAEDAILPALAEAFTECGKKLTTFGDARVVSVSIDFHCRCAITALRVVKVHGTALHWITWGRRIIAAFLEAVQRASNKHPDSPAAKELAKSLTDAVCQLVSSQLEVPVPVFLEFMQALKLELCELIRCSEPRIAGPLAVLFRRYMEHSQSRES